MSSLQIHKPTNLPIHNPPHTLLFGPGPCNIDPRIKKSLGSDLVGHLDPYFVEMMNNIQDLLRYVWQTNNDATLTIPGTGSAAMETTIANLVQPGDVVCVGVNGYFGTRLAEMARRYGATVHEVSKSWGDVYTLEEIQNAIDTYHPSIFCLVHGETSTGACQPMEGIGALCHANDCLLLLDTVTTTGGVPVLIDEWEVDAAYSCSQKCLGCTPGASPVTFSPRAMDIITARQNPSTWYFDINLLMKYWSGETRAYHHTAPISVVYGLYESLKLIAEEGIEERWERHAAMGAALADGLASIGLTLKIENPETRMPQLTTVKVPEGVDPVSVMKSLRTNYNIAISGGLGELKGQIWRIGLMGYNAKQESVDLLVESFKNSLSE